MNGHVLFATFHVAARSDSVRVPTGRQAKGLPKVHQHGAVTTDCVDSVLKKSGLSRASTGHPRFFNMFSTGWRARASLRYLVLTFALLVGSMDASAQSSNTSLFRVFLLNGDTLISYGEFARVGDRVVISVPLGDTPQN